MSTLPRLLAVGLSIAVSASLHASVQRTFVSSTGADINPCSRTAPCRNFAAAITAVSAGGEVVVLDSAGYGPFTVNKSVTVVSPPGVCAGVTSFGGPAVTVAASVTDSAALSGLTITNLAGADGILISAIGDLHVKDVTVTTIGTGVGVNMQATGGKLSLSNSLLRNNSIGVLAQASIGTTSVSISHVRSEGSGSDGFKAGPRVHMTISDSAAVDHTNGFHVAGDALTLLSASFSTASNNIEGFLAETNGTLRISNCTAVDNGVGIEQKDATVFDSLGNNFVAGNVSDFSGTINIIFPY
jgi:hypothetical protein